MQYIDKYTHFKLFHKNDNFDQNVYFFYIQIYNTNNKDIDFTKISIKPLKNNKFSYKCTKKYNDQLYKDTRRIVIVSFIMFFSIFFMADLYICTGGILVY